MTFSWPWLTRSALGRAPSRPAATAARQPSLFSRRSSGLVISPTALMATRV
jgi:hypothetical protein